MTTQVFKAKDIKTAQGLVSDEFGDDAIILSTKKNNGLVEIEASNNDEVIKRFPRKRIQDKNFSKIFLKKLEKNINEQPKRKFSSTDGINTVEEKIKFDEQYILPQL